ncbi:MAG: hypothetical protein MR681_04875 [Prevotella sp.]|nr:hypothetical protein [Prevotella sp.]
MKSRISLCIVLTFLTSIAFAQNNIRMTYDYGSESKELLDFTDFENIFVEQLNFQGQALAGKTYIIGLEEYENGKLKDTTMLFDGAEDDYFKITSDSESLKFFFKLANGKLKTFVKGKKFGSKKAYFNLKTVEDAYILKDFFGSQKEIFLKPFVKNAVFAIISPTVHADGFGSYCEVVQSGVNPEDFGNQFGIPHYFLVTIVFR